ncbi:helicase-related protein [uncultured Sphingomonas sp.]|uniref:helicase-related protein n=1 Tax=uncultured Sphingomonas sp. TaxID=158754 RepID=UPI0035CB169E
MSDVATDPFASHETFRDALVDRLVRQLFGPLPTDEEAERTETLTVSPLQLYATGILFPQRVVQETLEDSRAEEAVDGVELDAPREVIDLNGGAGGEGRSEAGDAVPEREPLNLANEFSPSAAGLSFCLAAPATLRFTATFGLYDQGRTTEVHPRAGETGLNGKPFPAHREVTAWKRRHFERTVEREVGTDLGSLAAIPLDDDKRLSLRLTVRRRADGIIVVSAMLVNELRSDGVKAPSSGDVFYQAGLGVTETLGSAVFLPIDRSVAEASSDPEVASLDLLYRHRRAFALGHGTASDWNRAERLSEAGATDLVRTAAVPSYDLKPIVPREASFRGATPLNLAMGYLFNGDGTSAPEGAILIVLRTLADDYESWIAVQDGTAQRLAGSMKKAAESNLENCRSCLARMRTGIALLASDEKAMTAFRLMNKAMFVQQHRSRLPRRDRGTPQPQAAGDGHGNRWRPFQLGFILMNLASAADENDPERSLVDLIWFPTGGGKTEAYLGLSAFTIILGRLRGGATGTTVLMRYTLRLLTAQQFQRASALVLAIEALRTDGDLGCDLGKDRISIGLWVGRSLSPNARDDARARLRAMQKDRFASNPFQVLQCPWCGVDFTDRGKLGYQEARPRDGGPRTVALVCPDETCRYGKKDGLPVLVIDEDLYAEPPTVLIGTVDKFAQIAWDKRVGRLFGIGVGAPPALVIQDELHLISGPLGTIVGLYETAIDRLCSRDGHVHKIVASTATIRRARQQCSDLYARDAFEFPPQAIRAGESYFALEKVDAPGRRYVGFMGNAVKSHQTALVRACSPLLQGVCYPLLEDQDRERAISDPYGTLVWYFNSLRELGHAATLCVGDIPEFLKGYCHRQRIAPGNRRYIREIIELTSRRGAEEIPEILQQLEIPWRLKPVGRPPVDVLLATNMIAVGVDVPRLGAIVMSGQPKGTSEYIQASSRVGRSFPGLVVTVYTQTKSRDRSHYERFVAYHQSLYRHVEPTSVTPFSPQARERGIRGVLVGMARLLGDVDAPDMIKKMQADVEDQVEAILDRAKLVDDGEVDEAREEIEAWVADWKRYSPPTYGKMGGTPAESTLMYPYGSTPDEAFQRDAWPVLTSMRNVDGTSTALVLNKYPVVDAEA